MKITTSLSPPLIDAISGALSLPAIALIGVGCVLLFALAVLGSLGLRLLWLPVRVAIHSLSGPRRAATVSSHH